MQLPTIQPCREDAIISLAEQGVEMQALLNTLARIEGTG